MYIAFVRKAAPRMAVREDPVATSLPMEAA
jgi:hypothetical protein